MRTMISDILAQAGLEVVGEAETGLQAVEKYRQLKPDLVTMDIVMPDMGGIDAVREICKLDPDAKILVCSAMGQQALVVEAIQAGAKDFVVKPFQPSRSSRPSSASSADSMDLSQYAELFLAESREHLSACNQLLLEWERSPANLAPVGGLFRAVHTVKGMAATMGYARVTDLAHRAENLLDLLRRGGRTANDELLQLLFRARDAVEQAVELSVVGREEEIDVAEVVADLDDAAAQLGRAGEAGGGIGARPTPVPAATPAIETAVAAGRLVQVTLRAEAPLKGGRALLVIKKAQAVGPVHAVTPPESAFEADEFDGRFSFRIGGATGAADIERAEIGRAHV